MWAHIPSAFIFMVAPRMAANVYAFIPDHRPENDFGAQRVHPQAGPAMKHLTHVLLAIFWKFGGPGLLVLGILDSSFLFAPLGNDLLVVAVTARRHSIPLML